MNIGGLSHGARLVCIILAVGVHAAAAAAFMLAPAKEPPPPPPGVEIEMLAEITSVVAEEVTPSVAAEAQEVEQASEARAGENAADAEGEMAKEVAALDQYQPEVTPDEVEEVQKPSDQAEPETPTEAEAEREARAAPETEVPPEAKTEREAKAAPEAETPPEAEPEAETPAEQAPVTMPVELEKPVTQAPQAPALAEQPKPRSKATRTAKPKSAVKTKSTAKAMERKSKTVKRQALIAGSMVTRNAKRKGESAANSSGGRKSSSEYRSIVQARLSARRSAISASFGSGIATVTFVIGSSGRVTSASVSKSSGNPRLDAIARSVVAATSFPPPPGGSFSFRVPIGVR